VLQQGESLLVPASLDDFIIAPKAVGTSLLETYIRQIEEEPDNYLN
jgi:hypothetical protein